MTLHYNILLILIGLVLIDSCGDAFRFKAWQVIAHISEVIQIAGWIALWAFFEFSPAYIVMYILARVILFAPLWNILTGHGVLYVGTSNLYDKSIRWFASIWPVAYQHVHLVIIALSLFVWIAAILNQSIF